LVRWLILRFKSTYFDRPIPRLPSSQSRNGMPHKRCQVLENIRRAVARRHLDGLLVATRGLSDICSSGLTGDHVNARCPAKGPRTTRSCYDRPATLVGFLIWESSRK
jgi:hypothetical protein